MITLRRNDQELKVAKAQEGDGIVEKVKKAVGEVQERILKRAGTAMSETDAMGVVFREHPDWAAEFQRASYR